MPDKPSAAKTIAGAGCAVLFALPFAGFGLFMAWSLGSMLWLAWEASSWVEVPATVTRVELQGGDEGSQKVLAEYRYQAGGVLRQGARVGLSDMADNFGSYHQKLYRRLHDAWKAERPVPCYVDPDDPERAILDRRLRPLVVLFHVPFVLCFGGVGFGILGGAIYASLASQRKAESPANLSESPWLARDDWRRGVIRDSRNEFYALVVFALLWNSISFPIGAMLLFGDKKVEGWWVYPLVLMFPAIGVGMVVWVVRQWLRWRKYGRSSLRLAKTPGVIGGQLTGVILAPAAVSNAECVKLTLTCTRTVGSGDDTKTELVWQDEREVGQTLADSQPGSVGVPVVFTIPSHVPETSDDSRIAWTLKAKAALPGIDYATSFEVPVFRTPDSQEGVEVDAAPLSEFEVDRPLEDLLGEEGIVVEPLAELHSIRYVAPAGRNRGMAWPLTIVTLIFAGASIGLLLNSIWIIGVPSGLVSLLLVYATLDAWLSESELTVTDERWTVHRGWRGLRGTRREFESRHVRDVRLQTGMTSQSGSEIQRYQDVVATLRGEPKPVKLLSGMRGTAAARKLVAELRRRAGIDG